MEKSRVTAVVAFGLVGIAGIFFLMVRDSDEDDFQAYDPGDDAVEVADTGLGVPSVTAMRRAGDEEEDAPTPVPKPSGDSHETPSPDDDSPVDDDSRAAIEGTEDTLNRPGPTPSDAPGDSADSPPSGTLDRETIRRGVDAVTPLVKVCYEDTLKDFPDAAGKITVGFRIIGEEGEGRVEMSELDPEQTTLFDERLHDCMLKTIGDARFEAPEGGGVVNVRYPFVFETDAETFPDE